MNNKKSRLLILYALASVSCLTGCKKEEVKTEISKEELAQQEKTKREEEIRKSISLYEEGVTPLYIDNILVVNKEYSIPENFVSELDFELLEQFEKMKEAAKEDGLDINIRSGFRNTETQTMLYNNYVKRDGVEKANRYSAKPGHSEHETGLAIDISNGDAIKSIGDWFNDTPQAKWLYENAHNYGFILRYPEGKEEITGYKYESWHYRYVGVEHSQYFNGNNLTLEEYLGLK